MVLILVWSSQFQTKQKPVFPSNDLINGLDHLVETWKNPLSELDDMGEDSRGSHSMFTSSEVWIWACECHRCHLHFNSGVMTFCMWSTPYCFPTLVQISGLSKPYLPPVAAVNLSDSFCRSGDNTEPLPVIQNRVMFPKSEQKRSRNLSSQCTSSWHI